MGLNCKAGDLAIKVIQGEKHFIPGGAVVQVIEPALMFNYRHVDGSPINVRPLGHIWRVSYGGEEIRNGMWLCVPDAWLKPIHDQPGEDETLRYAGKPAPVVRKLTAPEFDAAVKGWEKA